jgi:hypothetical protein
MFGAPTGTELGDAEQLKINLADPTTGELYIDPVVASSGHTFERAAILDWMRTEPTCPVTRDEITHVLLPNRLIKSIVEQFVSTYKNRVGDEWAEIRAACLDREALKASELLSHDEAASYIRQRLTTDGRDKISDHIVYEIIRSRHRATENYTKEYLDARYTEWREH